MDYQEHYDRLISRAKERKLDCYTESHHIIPRCMGGADDKNNLVDLTAREHFIAHLLLMKIYPKSYGLVRALHMMCISSKNQERSMNRMYGWLKEKFSISQKENQKGEKNSQFGSMWISHPEKRINKKIRDNIIPDGWCKGRNVWVKIEKVKVEKDYSTEKNETILLLREFISSEFKTLNSFIKGTDISFSLVTFTKRLKKHIPEYQHITQGCRDVKSILSKYYGPIA